MNHRFAIIVAALTVGSAASLSQAIPPSPGEGPFAQPITSPAVGEVRRSIDVSEPRRLPGDQFDAKRLLPGDQFEPQRLPGDQYDRGRRLPGDQFDAGTLQRR